MEEFIRQALIDEEAMTSLLKELEPFVYRLSYHLTRHQHDAEDLAQEVLYKICTKLSLYRGDSSLQTWVYSLVLNTYKDTLRKRKVRQFEELTETAATQSFENASNSKILLESLLEDLPEIDRHILILRFQNDLSVREVADIMNISEANVKTRVFRLKDRLRNLFRQGGEVL
ncbi:RNA polymerase sigma factor [Effusibacillus dendaii]|uniref:DNA-directed RNA polymerase sigma-70 factor n=1 Tax=Effusibacillus dendaii TaxID=2743772 RepID=A0A7I8DF75_9BACL|nr:RNA polymerase sigma factor [Effusibacillus dendaii]BCJ87210.1 DNA-directed RNA polymerase sigma-70 factor [Effusibacillus dendaii]